MDLQQSWVNGELICLEDEELLNTHGIFLVLITLC